jgi:hypothetical protein
MFSASYMCPESFATRKSSCKGHPSISDRETPTPPRSASQYTYNNQLSSAKHDYAFCFFFWKKKISTRSVGFFLGASPNPSLVPLRGRFGAVGLLRSGTTLFASFSGKRWFLLGQSVSSWGQTPVVPLCGRFGAMELLLSRSTLFASFFF